MGVQGLADVFVLLDLPFESDEKTKVLEIQIKNDSSARRRDFYHNIDKKKIVPVDHLNIRGVTSQAKDKIISDSIFKVMTNYLNHPQDENKMYQHSLQYFLLAKLGKLNELEGRQMYQYQVDQEDLEEPLKSQIKNASWSHLIKKPFYEENDSDTVKRIGHLLLQFFLRTDVAERRLLAAPFADDQDNISLSVFAFASVPKRKKISFRAFLFIKMAPESDGNYYSYKKIIISVMPKGKPELVPL